MNGELKGIIPDYQKQPHGNQKTIMLNCWKWKLKFIKDDTNKRCTKSTKKIIR